PATPPSSSHLPPRTRSRLSQPLHQHSHNFFVHSYCAPHNPPSFPTRRSSDLTPLGNLIRDWGMGVNFYISQGEYWRLITSIFLHAGLMHVLFNSFALVLFGPALEQMLGKLKFIATFLGAGLIGNLATFLLGPALYSHVGAS